MVTITDLLPGEEPQINQAAAVMVEAFRDWPDTYATLEEALEEVHASLGEGRISRIALDEHETVVGWIGGIRGYDGHAWELHPLAVRPDWQRRGVGRTLVADLERIVRDRGGTTVYLGTDDEDGRTSLADTDLYPNVWEHIAQIENHGNHPFAFYQRCGYVITGVIPDANGPGKPDILMAKRVAR